MLLRTRALMLAALLPGCASRPPEIPVNMAVGPAALPTPRVAANGALPQILAMRFSTLDVRRGRHWSGTFITGTNVASVEVRTNLFSINVPRRGSGRFGFTLNVLDAPPIFVRAYRLRVIARNSAGAEYEIDVPLRIR